MNQFQDLIIKQNQRIRNTLIQNLIITGQFFYTLIWIFIAISILGKQEEELHFKIFYYFSLSTISLQFNIDQVIIQSITIIFSFTFLFSILFGGNYKYSKKIVDCLWDAYPNICQIVIIQNSGHQLLRDDINFFLGVLNIIMAIGNSQLSSVYSFSQNNTQKLIKSYFERGFIPFCYSVLALFAGLQLNSLYLSYLYLGMQLIFDLYFGILYYIKPHMQYLNIKMQRLVVLFSFLRFPILIFLFYYQNSNILFLLFFSLPLMMQLHLILWDNKFLQFIYQTNMFFQYICVDKFREMDNQIECYIAYYFEIIDYKKPLNRVLMLSLFCNHMNMCQNIKCFCQNRNFHENVKITTQLLQLDVKDVEQQINYAVGEQDIQMSFKQLMLLFFDNYIKNVRYTIMGETLILKLSLYENQNFQHRLFQTKLRFQYLKILYHKFHPQYLERQATCSLITQKLQHYMSGLNEVALNLSLSMKYFKLLEKIQNDICKVTENKIIILELLKRNNQNPVPYLLHKSTQNYFNQCNELEILIQQLVQLNGISVEVRELQDEFYSQIKVDYGFNNIHQKITIPFINQNQTAFIICDYEGDLIIKDYSNHFIQMIKVSSQIKGGAIEQIVPVSLQQYHRYAIGQMINTGKTKLVNKEQYSLMVKSEKYILEVDALLRFDYRQLEFLRFIGFIQLRDKDSILVLANEKGKLDSYSRSAGILLKLDEVDCDSINYFNLSPCLLQQKLEFEFDGLLLVPKRYLKTDILGYMRFFLGSPEDCYIFIVNAKHQTKTYTSVTIQCLKINSFYQLKDTDLKILALDIMMRQIMILKQVSKSQYMAPTESVLRIQTFKKTFKFHQTHTIEFSEEEYNLIYEDDSEREIQMQSKNNNILPEFIPSLDSIRTQNEKLLLPFEQYRDYHNTLSKDKSFEQQQKLDTLEGSKSEQDSIKQKRNTHQIIEIELNSTEVENIEKQLQIILATVKTRQTRKELVEMKNQMKNKQKTSTWHGSGNQQNQKKLIRSIVNQFQNTSLRSLTQLKIISYFLVLINIGFILGFVINSIFGIAGIQMDSNNQTYPLTLFQDINLVLLGIQLADRQESNLELANNFILLGAEQYKNLSINVNDIQLDYHTFLQELDQEKIIVQEFGIQLSYYKKYFFKNFMVERLKTIEEADYVPIFGEESQFLFDNYPEIATQLWNLKNKTTRDVLERVDKLDQMSKLLLVLSILCNLIAIIIYLIVVIYIFQWRNQFYSTLFLFNNIQTFISLLSDSINKQIHLTPGSKIDDEEKNQKITLIWQLYGVLIFFILLLISLGFYIPLFLYIDSVNIQSIDVNQLQTELAMMQLKQSAILTWLTINQTESKYNKNFVHNTSIIQYVIDQCAPSEDFILYDLPFDSKYDYFPEIQQYSTVPLCDCSLLQNQLKNGYYGFQSYVSQHLYDQVQQDEIMEAYKIVFEYQINKKNEFNDYMQTRLANTQSTLQIILEISVIIIILIQTLFLYLIHRQIMKIVQYAKSTMYLFPPHILANNKYTLQSLIHGSTQ